MNFVIPSYNKNTTSKRVTFSNVVEYVSDSRVTRSDNDTLDFADNSGASLEAPESLFGDEIQIDGEDELFGDGCKDDENISDFASTPVYNPSWNLD